MKPASLSKVLLSVALLATAITSSTSAQEPTTREQVRADILDAHYGVAEALQLDAAGYEKLIELLTDQKLEQIEEGRRPGPPIKSSADVTDTLAASADRVNQNFAALRAALGPEKFGRYQVLRFTLRDRPQLRELDERLGTAHQLSVSQREQLAQLYVEQKMRQVHQDPIRPPGPPITTDALSPEELQRRSQLASIAIEAEAWRRTKAADRQLREQAAKFLSKPQLAMLGRMQAERTQDLQERVEQMRVQAGLSRKIPDKSEFAAHGPAKVAGEVKLSIAVIVNRGEPQFFTQVVRGGEPATFQIDEQLFVEATATLFENDHYEVRRWYFEPGTTGKRWLAGGASSGTLVRAPPEDPSRRLEAGGGGTIVTGNQAYAIQFNSIVEAT